jgi:hypothetical protein
VCAVIAGTRAVVMRRECWERRGCVGWDKRCGGSRRDGAVVRFIISLIIVVAMGWSMRVVRTVRATRTRGSVLVVVLRLSVSSSGPGSLAC